MKTIRSFLTDLHHENIRPGREQGRMKHPPLSFSQQRSWFLDLFEGQNAVHHIARAIHISGFLDTEVAEKALNEIIRRHDVLRAVFDIKDGQPFQRIAPELNISLVIVDLQDIPEASQAHEVFRIQSEDIRKPFDLAQGPLFRFSLLRLNEKAHVLLITMHPIVSDESSVSMLVREFGALCHAFSNGRLSPLPDIDMQYADAASWQKECLSGNVLESRLAYWKNQLEGVPTLLELPTDHPRAAVQSFAGKAAHFAISAETTQKLTELGRTHNATLFMTLYAGFAALLHRYSGSDDIVVGSPVTHRTPAEAKALIGPFGNTLVLRADLSDNPAFTELLTQARTVCLDAHAMDMPFELLVESLNPERSLSHHPLFQVMFRLQDAPDEDLLPGLCLTPMEPDHSVARFDLTLSMAKTRDGLAGTLGYDTGLFDKETAEQITDHFGVLLAGIADHPELRVSSLPMMTDAEHHRILTQWNDTATDHPYGKGVHQLFEEQAERSPDMVAVIFGHQSMTCGQLNARANQFAHRLTSLGVGPDVCVGICTRPCLEMIVGIMGILKAGGIYVPMDPSYPKERIRFMLEDSDTEILLTQEDMIRNFPDPDIHILCLDHDQDMGAGQSHGNPRTRTLPDQTIYTVYTSGSTGRPKGVLGTSRGLVNRLRWMWELLPFAKNEVCCQKTTVGFVDHLAEIFSPLLKGIPLVIIPDTVRTDIPKLTKLLADAHITRVTLVPSLLKAILELGPEHIQGLRGLRYVFCSGEPLSLGLARTFCRELSHARLFNIYGSSEVAADVTWFEVNPWETLQKVMQYFKPSLIHSFGEKKAMITEPDVGPDMLAMKFTRNQLPEVPETFEEYSDMLSREVLPYIIDTTHPLYVGHMTSALPDFVHDLSKLISQLNQNLVKVETSKSLLFLEREALTILHRLFYAFSDEFYVGNTQQLERNLGIITTGGTTANISAMLCARNKGLLRKGNLYESSGKSIYKALEEKGYEDIVIIGSQLMHYSFDKAASVLGLGTDNIIHIDRKKDGTLDPDMLRTQIRECKARRLYILALVGIAGTTETGEIDPLAELGDIAEEFGLYFHADAAWGGPTMFSEKHKHKLRGIEKADSITICGHKQLYLPQGISACLFKDPEMLNFVETTARYQAKRGSFDTGRFSIEGSRSALSLCLHAALHIIGQKGYEALINNGIDKAQYFSELVRMLEPFELILEPQLNIVNYRYVPHDLRANAQNRALGDDDNLRINALNVQIQEQEFRQALTFVSKTTLRHTPYGKDKDIVVLRAVLANPNTTVRDLHAVLEDQLAIANQIEAQKAVSDLDDAGSVVAEKENLPFPMPDGLGATPGDTGLEYLKKYTIPIGKPISNTQIYIFDKYENLVPPGVIGELHVSGVALASGYLNRPGLTAEKFVPDPFASDGIGRLYKTGDLCRYLRDGNIEFIGRSDHQVKIRGFRIELEEIESVLADHDAVRENAVVAKESEDGDQHLAAYVVPKAQDTGHGAYKFREWLKQKLPDYMIPSFFVVMGALPLTPNGKIDRKSQPEPDGSSRQRKAYIPPRNPVEEKIALIWAEVLNREKIGAYDNFFEIGGHSLLAVKVFSRLQEVFHANVPIRILFEFPVLSEFGRYVGLKLEA